MPTKDHGPAEPPSPPTLDPAPISAFTPPPHERREPPPHERPEPPPHERRESPPHERPELSANDEALLCSLGQWLHEREADEVTEAELDWVLPPRLRR